MKAVVLSALLLLALMVGALYAEQSQPRVDYAKSIFKETKLHPKLRQSLNEAIAHLLQRRCRKMEKEEQWKLKCERL